MKSEEFMSEANGYLSDVYEEFRRYQDLAWGALDALAYVCEKWGVHYQLTLGSLLGAVRDGGQIPWDYDIDVVVPYSERERLVEGLDADLPADYYYHGIESCGRCRHFLIRVCPKGFNSSALHVDIFFLVGTPASESDSRRHTNHLKRCEWLLYSKFVNAREESMGVRSRYLKLRLRNVVGHLVPAGLLHARYRQVCEKYPIEESEYVVSTSPSKRYRLPKDIAMGCSEVDLGGKKYMVPELQTPCLLRERRAVIGRTPLPAAEL